VTGRGAGQSGPPGRPFVVAHGSGNSILALRAAEALGVRAIEADVHLFRGRLEVRHLKTLGPIPLLWDRWKLANPFAPRLLVAELLAALDGRSELVLDLKGRQARLSTELLETLRPSLAAGHELTICARHWPLLDPFDGVAGVRVVHSVGSWRDLRRLRRRLGGKQIDAVTIHERLLDAPTVRNLREIADTVVTWPVNTVERAQELVRWGVDGLITDRPSLLQPAVGPEPQ
jgi:glycerophosphoryl diester phosphodiesterase